ncbi:MAG TPA: hypothetical protein VFR85_14220 [Anaeromyxobacteraceae bacterium]|nr:hypothetical protein [Anaeromyxobacteraceae bacterium]
MDRRTGWIGSRASLLSLALIASALLAPAGAAAACKGRVAGSVSGKFGCEARVFTNDEGQVFFVIAPKDQLPDVPAYQPGSFELPERPAAKRYTLETLGMGMASVAREGGTLFTATKTSGQRGEVTLTLKSVKPDPKVKGAYAVHGSYRARLLPAGAGKEGEVVVEVDF